MDERSWLSALKRLGLRRDGDQLVQNIATVHLGPPTNDNARQAAAHVSPGPPETPVRDSTTEPSVPGALEERDGAASTIFHRFVRALSKPEDATRVDGERLGAFWPAYSSYRQLRNLASRPPVEEQEEDPIDLDQEGTEVDMVDIDELTKDMGLVDLESPTMNRAASRQTQPEHIAAPPQHQLQLPTEPPSTDDGIPPSLDETQVTVFQYTCFEALATTIHPRGQNHSMNPSRVQFPCARQLRKPAKDADETSQRGKKAAIGDRFPCLDRSIFWFKAAVDAVVESRVRFVMSS